MLLRMIWRLGKVDEAGERNCLKDIFELESEDVIESTNGGWSSYESDGRACGTKE